MSDWEDAQGRLARRMEDLRHIADILGNVRLSAVVDGLAEEIEDELSEGVEPISDDKAKAYAMYARMFDKGGDADRFMALNRKIRELLVALVGQVNAQGNAELQGTMDVFGRTFLEFITMITAPPKAEEPAEATMLLSYTPAKKRRSRKAAGSPLKKALKAEK